MYDRICDANELLFFCQYLYRLRAEYAYCTRAHERTQLIGDQNTSKFVLSPPIPHTDNVRSWSIIVGYTTKNYTLHSISQDLRYNGVYKLGKRYLRAVAATSYVKRKTVVFSREPEYRTNECFLTCRRFYRFF